VIRALLTMAVLAGAARAIAVDYPILHPGRLDAAKAKVAAQDASVTVPFEALRAQADEALRLEPRSVMDKTLTAASGDPHDYFSFGPYWWPDPSKADGLPYIRRDGETNPKSRQGTDRPTVQAMGEAFEALALAYHFTGHEPYAEQAVRLLRAWFLDPATRMNPHLQHAQAIPGINDGRGIGIIEGRYLLYFTEAQPFVFDSPAWTKGDERDYRRWRETFLHWLLTSDNGKDEADEPNNHGTWYDVQVVELHLSLGHRAEARAYVEEALAHRIATQIEPDGRQPHELARTRSFNYCALNLAGLLRLAVLAENVGVDAWRVNTPDGRSLQKAVAFLAPYVDPDKEWLATNIDAQDRPRIVPMLVEALRHVDDDEWRRLLSKYEPSAASDARWRLFR